MEVIQALRVIEISDYPYEKSVLVLHAINHSDVKSVQQLSGYRRDRSRGRIVEASSYHRAEGQLVVRMAVTDRSAT